MSMNLSPDEEFALSELVREARGPRVERSPMQIASVEQAILAKLQPRRLSEKKRSSSFRPTRIKQMLALAACVVLVVWLGRVWTDFGAQQAWAQVAETIRGKRWIHGICRGADNTSAEIWLSPVQMTAAMRIRGTVVSFSDFREGVLREYNQGENVLSLRPIGETDLGEFRLVADLFETISEGRDPAQLKRAEVVEQSRREVKVGDKVWTEIEFTLRRRTGQGDTTRLVFRIDPASHLPQSMTFASTDQPNPNQPNTRRADQPTFERRFVLDYPATGPADIYALDVPKDAKTIDCGASPNVQKLVKAIEAGRPKFDHYVAIVVPNFSVERWWECWNGLYRVYHKGDRWRVEQSFPYSSEVNEHRRKAGGPVDQIDHAQWWLAEAKERFFFPLQVCDGKALYQYEYDFAKGTDNGHGDLQPVLTAPPQAESVVPSITEYRWSKVMPDLVGRPTLGIPSPHLSVRLDMHPTTGPSGSVLLESKSVKAASIHGPSPDLGINRFWIDPRRNYLVTRWEQSSLKDDRETLSYAGQIVKTAVTPKGQYYPLEVRIENSTSPNNSQLFSFYVDFNVEVADELFDPKSK